MNAKIPAWLAREIGVVDKDLIDDSLQRDPLEQKSATEAQNGVKKPSASSEEEGREGGRAAAREKSGKKPSVALKEEEERKPSAFLFLSKKPIGKRRMSFLGRRRTQDPYQNLVRMSMMSSQDIGQSV